MSKKIQNSKFKIQNSKFSIITITVRQPIRTAKFEEIGRRAVGGLRNGDLLIASKVRSIRFTDDKRRPHKFRLARFLRYFLAAKSGKKKEDKTDGIDSKTY